MSTTSTLVLLVLSAAISDRDKNGTNPIRLDAAITQPLVGQLLGQSPSFPAERTGFEPADQLPGHGFSKPAH